MYKTRRLLFGIFLLGCLFLTFSGRASAVSTKQMASYYVNNGSGNTGWHSQGATMTKDYYIWTDWKKPSGPTVIVMCKRSKPSDCWRSSSKSYGHASTLYHRWGTDYFIVKAVADVKACWSISQKKEVSKSKCSALMKDVKFGKVITYTHDVAQGYTKYGDYYLRSYGNTPGANYITLFDKNFEKVKDVKLPNWVNEVEDVMVDGTTGTVYFSVVQYVNGKKQVQFHRIAKSVFSEWIKPNASTSSGSSSSSNSSGNSTYTGPTTLSGDFNSDFDTTMGGSIETTYDGIVDTLFFGTLQDDGEGCGVYSVLSLVMTIMTIGIGITAVISIAISGIMYLTSGSNVARATKAKRRILETIIGLIAYAAIAAILAFVLPEFNPELKECQQATPEAIAERNARRAASGGGSDNKSKESSSKEPASKNEAARKRIAQYALKYAWPYSVWHKQYKKGMSYKDVPKLRQVPSGYGAAFRSTAWKYIWGADYPTSKNCHVPSSWCVKSKNGGSNHTPCSVFASTVVRKAIPSLNKTYPKGFPVGSNKVLNYLKTSKCWKEVSLKNIEPGDIDVQTKNGVGKHTAIVVSGKGTKATLAEAGTTYGRVRKSGNHSVPSGRQHNFYRYTCE